MLSLLDFMQQGLDDGVSGLDFTIEAKFSPDGKFVYALNDFGSVTSFQLTSDDENAMLKFVEAFRDDDLLGARGLVLHPLGTHLFVACRAANTLVAMRRDDSSGWLTIVDVAKDEVDGVTGLRSAFGVGTSMDGKFLYTVSGRFGKGYDDSVGVFKFDNVENKLTCVHETTPDEIELDGNRIPFEGGNEITLDPAQQKVYACATISGSLAVFDRDLATGMVTLVQVFHDPEILGMVAGLAMSPDGRFVYAACEQVNSIAVFRAPVAEVQPTTENGEANPDRPATSVKNSSPSSK